MTDNAWNYFDADPAYAEELARRLHDGVVMDSARGLGELLQEHVSGDLSIIDFGSGPGHYAPVIRDIYQNGRFRYRGVDIIEASIAAGNRYFANDPAISFEVGSVLDPRANYGGENCVISANTLPHVPTIEPLLRMIADEEKIEYFLFRLLIGQECVEIKKHLSEDSFVDLFGANFQHNNIYSERYFSHLLGDRWALDVFEDRVDLARLSQHSMPAQEQDAFYGNRVSRAVEGMTFKGDIYMPWKFLLGRRKN